MNSLIGEDAREETTVSATGNWASSYSWWWPSWPASSVLFGASSTSRLWPLSWRSASSPVAWWAPTTSRRNCFRSQTRRYGSFCSSTLPVLMFTSAFNLRHHLFRQCFWQCVLLGCGGLAFSTMLFMLYMSGTRDAEQQNLAETVLISLLTCCAEPDVRVGLGRALIRSLPHSRDDHYGGSLWLASLASGWLTGSALFPVSSPSSPFLTRWYAHCSWDPIFGKIFGRVLAMATIALSQDLPISFIVNVTSVIATWAFAEKFLYGAGITTIVSMGLTASAHSAATVQNPVVLRKFWMLVRYGYNVVIVFLSAYRIGRDTRQHLGWHEIMSPINAYVAKIGVRFVTTIVLYPLLASVGYDLSWQQCLIVAWANFKGAIMIGLDLTRAFPTINLAFALKEQFVRMGTLFLVQLLNTTTLPEAYVDARVADAIGRRKG
ncbi:hypothetical protein MTO96_021978 [Rhipicephalus appendiculatus]